jgi:integrase
MALTDAKVRNAKVPTGKKSLKLSDGEGLFLFVTGSSKTWRQKYRFNGKESVYTHGKYPSMTLKQARKGCSDVKDMISNNIDPNQRKQAAKLEAMTKATASTFQGIALEFIDRQSTVWSATYTYSTRRLLEKYIFPWLGAFKIEDVKASDVLVCLRRIEELGFIEATHKTRMICGQVFRYAIASGLCEYDPIQALKGALQPKQTKHRPCFKKPKDVGGLMRSIAGFGGTLVVKCALRLSPLVFLRPTELRHAEWEEIDIEAKEWRIPATKMKMRVEHVIPLSRQALAILEEVQAITGDGKYVFPNIRKPSRAISENTINNALQRMGYDTKIEHCAHGFRGTASTLLHEQGFPHDVIESQLAHKTGSEVSRAYNHYQCMNERIPMMQQWADYLDALRDGADVVPIKRTA